MLATRDYIFEEFCRICPWAARKTNHWWDSPNEPEEITIVLCDGSAMQYDYIMKTFRHKSSLDELIESRKIHGEEEWRRAFAIRLYKLMRIYGWGQEGLAYRTGISQGTISKYVNGDRIPSAYNIWKIAKVLGCSEADLLGV